MRQLWAAANRVPSLQSTGHETPGGTDPIVLLIWLFGGLSWRGIRRFELVWNARPSARQSAPPKGNPARRNYFFLGPSILLSTIFRASANASVGDEHGFVAASFSPSSSCIVTMKPAWRVRSMKIISFGLEDHGLYPHSALNAPDRGRPHIIQCGIKSTYRTPHASCICPLRPHWAISSRKSGNRISGPYRGTRFLFGICRHGHILRTTGE